MTSYELFIHFLQRINTSSGRNKYAFPLKNNPGTVRLESDGVVIAKRTAITEEAAGAEMFFRIFEMGLMVCELQVEAATNRRNERLDAEHEMRAANYEHRTGNPMTYES